MVVITNVSTMESAMNFMSTLLSGLDTTLSLTGPGGGSDFTCHILIRKQL